MNLFQIAPNDQSIYYLGRIFGNVGNVLAGTGPALLGEMFRTFNSILLGFAAMIIVYSTVVGLINTAAEGDFLGKKWNKFWTPIRIVAGIIALFPLPASGYCLIQVVMMWFIMQGVGAADTVWTRTVDYLLQGGAVQTPTPGSEYASVIRGDVMKLYRGLVCQAAFEKHYCPGEAWCSTSHEFDPAALLAGGSYKMGPSSVCGTLSIDWEGIKNRNVALAQLQSYKSIVPTLKKIATYQVGAQNEYSAFYDLYTHGMPSTRPDWLPAEVSMADFPSPYCEKDCTKLGAFLEKYAISPYAGSNFIRDSSNLYVGYLFNAATSAMRPASDKDKNRTTKQDNVDEILHGLGARDSAQMERERRQSLEQSKANGWVFAGAYYYTIASMNNKTADEISTGFALEGKATGEDYLRKESDPFFKSLNEDKKIFEKIKKDYDPASLTIKVITGEQAKGRGEGSMQGVGTGIHSFGQALVRGWIEALSSTANRAGKAGDADIATNPLVKLQSFGKWLLIILQVFFAVFFVTMVATVGIANTCAAMQGFGVGVDKGFSYILVPLMFFMGAMFIFAATLAVYLPLVPYILFTFGVIGWLIATIETMIAAPIVAIGIMLPEGGHEVWGHAGPAGKIVFNIVLRPTLMVFGMMAGMLLSYVVVTFINAAFLGVMDQIGAPGMVEVVLFMMIYTGLLISALNKCFSLIHVVPDKVLRFIGGGGEQFGEAEAGKEAAQEFKGSAGEVKGAPEKTSKQMAQAKKFGEKAEAAAAKKKTAAAPTLGGNTPRKKPGT